VVDLGAITSLRGIRLDGDELVVGAMVTYSEVVNSALVLAEAALVAQVAATVGDARSDTVAPSAARSRTPTRPVTCPPSRWPWTPRWC